MEGGMLVSVWASECATGGGYGCVRVWGCVCLGGGVGDHVHRGWGGGGGVAESLVSPV